MEFGRPSNREAGPWRDLGYARISKDDRQRGEGVGRQTEDVTRTSEQAGGDLVDMLVDNDVPASRFSTKDREAYDRLLELLRAGVGNRVVVYRLDRLLRIPRQLEDLIDLCTELGVPVLNLNGSLDLSTAEGRKYARDRVSDAAYEMDLLSERLKRRFDQAAARGEPHGARPFGYSCLGWRSCGGRDCQCHGGADCDHDPPHKMCCRQPECAHDGRTVIGSEAGLVRLGAEAIIAGESLSQVARGLNAVSVLMLAFGHNPPLTPRLRRPWNGTMVRETLTARRHVGIRVHRRGTQEEVEFPGDWEPILDIETHEAVVRRLDRNGPATPPRRQTFTGVLRDVHGQSMSRDLSRGRATYRSIQRRHGVVSHPLTTIRAEHVEAYITELLLSAVEDGSVARRVVERRLKASRSKKLTAVEDPVAIGKEILQAAEDEASGLISRPVWLAKHQRLTTRLERAQAATAASDPHGGTLAAIPASLRDEWETLSVDRRRAILLAVFERVEILPSERRGGGPFQPERVRPVWRV